MTYDYDVPLPAPAAVAVAVAVSAVAIAVAAMTAITIRERLLSHLRFTARAWVGLACPFLGGLWRGGMHESPHNCWR